MRADEYLEETLINFRLKKCCLSSASDSLTAKMEQDLTYQGNIRYKCPYGMLLKICDFGLSQNISRSQETSTRLQTQVVVDVSGKLGQR
jgi:hypothetical protein